MSADYSDIKDAAIYVGTYKKYNEGSLFGEWMQLSDYANREDFYKACRELHKDEEDPEFMFQDREYIPDSLVGESWVSEKVWDLMRADEEDLEIVTHYINACSIDIDDYDDIEDLIREARDKFVGHYESLEDLGIEMAEVEGTCSIPEWMERYFDYESYGRDIAYDYYEDDGYYFDTNR